MRCITKKIEVKEKQNFSRFVQIIKAYTYNYTAIDLEKMTNHAVHLIEQLSFIF